MIYYDYFLKAPSESAANDALTSAGLHSFVSFEGYEGYEPAEGVSIYMVGVLYDPAEYDEEGNEVTPAVALEGWHVNLRVRGGLTPEQVEALSAVLINPPATPQVIFG